MAYCKACRHKHRGWSCPTCGAASKALVFLTVFLPAFAVTAGVLLLLPRACAPCIVELPAGATRYALSSHHMALALPLLFGTGGLCVVLTSLRRKPPSARAERLRRWRAAGPLSKVVAVSWSGCLHLFAVVAVVTAVWLPQKAYRAVDVDGDDVVLRGAFAPRHLDRAEIVRADVRHVDSTGRQGRRIVLLSIDIEDDRGRVHRSSYAGHEPGSPGYAVFEQVLVALADELDPPAIAGR